MLDIYIGNNLQFVIIQIRIIYRPNHKQEHKKKSKTRIITKLRKLYNNEITCIQDF